MRSADYWRGRFAILEDAAQRDASQCFHEIEEMFRAAEYTVQADIERWYGQFAANNKISLTDAKKWLTTGQLEEFRWTVDQYVKVAKSAHLFPEWQKKLANASARFHISRLESIQLRIQHQLELLYGNQLDSIDGLLKRVVSNGYTRSAFEIQKGIGLGWDITAIDTKRLNRLLSKPWTADKKTFRDRCWEGQANLVSRIQSQLVQGLLRGDSHQKITAAISKQFGVSKYKAGRLVHTETTYFTALSHQETYKALHVEQVEIVETLDTHTCQICQPMDGKRLPLSQFAPGVTVPPFHPNCRGTTCPAIDDEDAIGQRAARDKDGNVYYVPADMTYEQWKQTFAEGGSKEELLQVFQPMGQYRQADGAFDLDSALADYKKFLPSVPKRCRMYLQQAVDAVGYEETALPDAAFGYLTKNDTIVYNPSKKSFYRLDFRVVNTHELAHRIDRFFTKSWEDAAFQKAVADARAVVDKQPDLFVDFCAQNDTDGFLSDIFSAICEDDYRFPFYHKKEYWQKPWKKEMEIFANLFSLEAVRDVSKLNFIEKHFPELLRVYQNLPFKI